MTFALQCCLLCKTPGSHLRNTVKNYDVELMLLCMVDHRHEQVKIVIEKRTSWESVPKSSGSYKEAAGHISLGESKRNKSGSVPCPCHGGSWPYGLEPLVMSSERAIRI